MRVDDLTVALVSLGVTLVVVIMFMFPRIFLGIGLVFLLNSIYIHRNMIVTWTMKVQKLFNDETF